MKYRIITIIASVISLFQVTINKAYVFSFSNHTNQDVNIKIQLAGFFEREYEQHIPAKKSYDFRFVLGGDEDNRKFGFCLNTIKISTEDMPWKNAPIKWIETQSYDSIIKASQKFADGLVEVAIDIANA